MLSVGLFTKYRVINSIRRSRLWKMKKDCLVLSCAYVPGNAQALAKWTFGTLLTRCGWNHFKGALEAGASVKELSYIFALVMREAAGADDCWTHDVLGDWREIIEGNVSCECQK